MLANAVRLDPHPKRDDLTLLTLWSTETRSSVCVAIGAELLERMARLLAAADAEERGRVETDAAK